MNRKLLALFISLFLVFSSISVNASDLFQNDINGSSTNSYLESYSLKDAQSNSEIQKYISDKGYTEKVYKFINEKQTINKDDKVNVETNKISDILSSEEIKKLSDKYGLKKPEEKSEKTIVLVERELSNSTSTTSTESITQPAAISNVWYLTYPVSDTGFSINILNVGLDSIDSITGTVKKYNKNQFSWSLESTKPISKSNVSSGTVFTWTTTKYYVQEKFEYDITVSEDGDVWKYNNINENNITRYNFDAGLYNSITANGGQRHHIVSSDALSSAGFNTTVAPVIRMIAEDHLNTSNWGSGTEQTEFRNDEKTLINSGQYEELLQLEVDGLERSLDYEGIYPNLAEKYYDEVIYALYLAQIYFNID